VITRLHAEVRRALGDETVRERYAAVGLVAVGSAPEVLAQTLQRDVARYAGLIRRGDLPLQ
jgi:tripartite-type tricarboxylate transporter receptor subunit TctC